MQGFEKISYFKLLMKNNLLNCINRRGITIRWQYTPRCAKMQMSQGKKKGAKNGDRKSIQLCGNLY